MTTSVASTTLTLVRNIFERIASNLTVLLSRQMTVSGVKAESVYGRVAGTGRIHISFKLGFARGDVQGHGCLLVPLPDAICLGGYLLMLPDAIVTDARDQTTLDSDLKDAMLEIGNFVGGAIDEAIRSTAMAPVTVRSEGCQGVRADVRPCFGYEEGTELIIGRATARVHQFPEFELILMIPAFATAG